VPADSQLHVRLAAFRKRPIVAGALRVARAARVERGLKPLLLAHYKTMAE
jgi:hypothetical protein